MQRRNALRLCNHGNNTIEMKSKYKILIHVLFWIYMLNQAFFPVYLNKIDTKLLQDYIYLKDNFITLLPKIFVFLCGLFCYP